jgi:transposase InsO family protein
MTRRKFSPEYRDEAVKLVLETFPNSAKARTAIAEYIEVFYNRQRIHSALGYRTPAQVEAGLYNVSQAA